jgi:hypothetical protein
LLSFHLAEALDPDHITYYSKEVLASGYEICLPNLSKKFDDSGTDFSIKTYSHRKCFVCEGSNMFIIFNHLYNSEPKL